jgi:hypothetical protein
VGIGAADEQALLGHRFQPAQRGRRRDRRGDAQARNRHSKLGDLGLQQVEQHVPGGVGEHAFVKIA